MNSSVYKLSLTDSVAPEIRPGKMGEFGGSNPSGDAFGFTNFYMTRNGQPFIPVVGEFHFSRFSYLHWEEELLKMKAGGIHILATYVFWNFHEEEEGRFEWGGDRNLRHFIDLCAKLDLPLILRIGPFCHGEVRNGGIPDWVFSKPIEIRSNDPGYLALANKLYREIAKQMKGSLYQDGGPVIAVQLENEFMHCGAPNDAWGYKAGKFMTSGTGGNDHLMELQRIAIEAGIKPLFFTATAWGGAAVPEQGTLPMLAGYAYTPWIPNQPPSREYVFRDLHHTPAEPVNYDTQEYPVAYCEMAGGMQVSYNARPYVPADSVEAMTLVKLASGSNLLGYYMYHGGSNPVGKKTYLNEQFLPKITYDYQSPLGEFGRVGESYDRIRTLSMFLEAFGGVLAPMATTIPEGQSDIASEDTSTLRWCVRQKDGSGFVFVNNFQDHIEMPDRRFRIELETSQGNVSFPSTGEITIQGGIGVVLPFNLDLGGIRLVSATVQLLTKLKSEGEQTFVFYAHEGMAPELVLSKASVTYVDPGDGTMEENGANWIVRPVAGREHEVRTRTLDGRPIRILVLTREEALQSYKLSLWDKETFVISDSHLFAHNNRLVCTSTNSEVTVFLLNSETMDLRSDKGTLERKKDGVFETIKISIPAFEPSLTVSKPSGRSALLKIDNEWPAEVNDVWLHIDYEGDVAEAYLGARLLTDHIYYGHPWHIGLKQFQNDLDKGDVHLTITPVRKGTVTTFVNQAQVERFEGVEIAEFRSILAIPEYQVSLFPQRV
jgi:Beta-galactosidase